MGSVSGVSGVGVVVADRLPINLGSSHVARTAVGVALPSALVAFLWLLGGCFAFFGDVFAILLASCGLGAFLVKLLKLGEPAPGVAANPTASPGAALVSQSPVVRPAAESTDAPVTAAPLPTTPVAADAPLV